MSLMPIKLTAIIVDYKTTARAKHLAASIKAAKHKDWEVVVVDNNHNNRGYGGGLNYGVARSTGEYLLFLNPDVEISPQTIEALVRYLEKHSDVGAVGPQIIDEAGAIVPSSVGPMTPLRAIFALSFLNTMWPSNRWSTAYWLKGWGRDTSREVSSINGACMMVRRSDFLNVGGFDESLFLYFEENDLCHRLHLLGKKIIFLADVHATHIREVSMRQAGDVSIYFRRSRRLYLRKYYGLLSMLLIEGWLFLTTEWRAFLLFFLALAPRLMLLDHILLIGDVGRDYLQALDMLAGKSLPLLGIPSSVPRFSQGPFNVWFDAASFALLGKNVYAPVIMSALFTSLAAVLLYRLLRKVADRNVSFAVTLLYVFSPAAIQQSRMPFYLQAVPLFTLVFLSSLLKLKSARPWSAFGAILAFCWLFQWELATIPLAAVLAYALYRRRLVIKQVGGFVLAGLIVGLLPQILFDLTHRCQQLCQFVVWMGYRTVAVSGIDKRHGLTALHFEFWQNMGTQLSHLLGFGWLPLLIVLGFIVGGLILAKKRKRALSELTVYALLAIFWLLVGLIIHGDPSEAYFPPFIVLICILVAAGIDSLPKAFKYFAMLLVGGLAVASFVGVTREIMDSPSINTKIAVAEKIAKQANGKAVTLELMPPPQFVTEGDDLRFLLRTVGGKLGNQVTFILNSQNGTFYATP